MTMREAAMREMIPTTRIHDALLAAPFRWYTSDEISELAEVERGSMAECLDALLGWEQLQRWEPAADDLIRWYRPPFDFLYAVE